MFNRFLKSNLFYSFTRSPQAILSFVIIVLLFCSAIFAPLLAPYDPYDLVALDLMNGRTPPLETNAFTGESFILGTDDQGQDVLSSIFYGLRISLLIAVSAVGFAMVIGVTLGLISAYVGGWVDAAIMRVADVQLTFPSILIALLLSGIARGILPVDSRDQLAIGVLIVSIGLSDWVQFARTVRGATLVEKEKEYVSAARLIGIGRVTILIKHVLPNVLSPVLVIATISLALAVISEATLSYLGAGVPITEPSLGTLIRFGQNYLFSGEWWIFIFPALTLLLLALSVNLLGDWLRDMFNPNMPNK